MALWNKLYIMIWLAFLEMILVLDPIEDIHEYTPFAHFIVGVAIVALAYSNRKDLWETACPDRVKRIGGAIFGMSIAAGVTGVLIRVDLLGMGRLFQLIHVVACLALMTQAASCATGYDMWEEKEFTGKVGPPEPLVPGIKDEIKAEIKKGMDEVEEQPQ